MRRIADRDKFGRPLCIDKFGRKIEIGDFIEILEVSGKIQSYYFGQVVYIKLQNKASLFDSYYVIECVDLSGGKFLCYSHEYKEIERMKRYKRQLEQKILLEKLTQ